MFDLRRQLLYPRTPLASALIGLFSHGELGSISSVYSSAARQEPASGFISIFPRRYIPYWDLGFLAPALDASAQASCIWGKLLNHISICGAKSGISRIYARTAEDPEVEDILHQVGYTMVSRSEIFVLVNRPSPVLAPRGLHRLEPRDAASIYHLYSEVVPPLAQQAEGLMPHWASLKSHHLGHIWHSREYIWAEKNRANAYLGLCETSHANWLEVVVRPEYRAEVMPLIKHILASSDNLDSAPVYCQVPDYSVGIGWVLRALGFESYAKQVAMVEYTMARVPALKRIIVPGLETGIDVSANARPVFRYDSQQREAISGPSLN
ncbi:MAG: hypothetical protein LLG44_01150 [Chloroflexi bacterium]|nr:hypothetical protein [Chloroflexota bacterium]